METIKIKGLKRVGPGKNMLVVLLQDNREATLNDKWQSNEINFIESVGIGGNFLGQLQQKGQYLNITDVDMNSANKATGDNVAVEKIVGLNIAPEILKEAKPTPEVFLKDDKIIAAVFVKCATKMAIEHLNTEVCDNEKLGEFLCMAVVELHGVYKLALDRLK